MKQMLFVRDFTVFTGGHLKVADYVDHVGASGLVEPLLFFTERSSHGSENPFLRTAAASTPRLRPADAYFVDGRDWRFLDAAGLDTSGRPVINLIQHVRHANPADERYRYLNRRALRVCVSRQVAQAIEATGRVNGGIVIIENGIDLKAIQLVRAEKKQRVFLGGFKNPKMAIGLARQLLGKVEIDLQVDLLPRPEFLHRVASASISVLLPNPIAGEGFFLPALEAMALGSAVVVPDCVGNRSFCENGVTCLMPDYRVPALAHAVEVLMADPGFASKLCSNGQSAAAGHSLEIERSRFLEIFRRFLKEFWAGPQRLSGARATPPQWFCRS